VRRAARIDVTQQEIVRALRRAGALVWIVGKEIDIVCQFRQRIVLMDAKRPKGRLTVTQERMQRDGWEIAFPASAEEALRAIGAVQ
jgi:hypothetical protein